LGELYVIEVKHQQFTPSVIRQQCHRKAENEDGRRVNASRPSDRGGQAVSTFVKIRFDKHYVIAVHGALTTTTPSFTPSFTSSSSSFFLVYILCLLYTYVDKKADHEALRLGVTICKKTAIGSAKVWLSRHQCRVRMHACTRAGQRDREDASSIAGFRSPLSIFV
jgi:hypothetical protein